MKRQSKKEWSYGWMESFGKPELGEKFYQYIGGKGPKPNVTSMNGMKKIVKTTMKFFSEIK